MFFHRFGVYQDIIKIYYNTMVKQVKEDGVDHSLKCGRCVVKPEGHDCELEHSVAARKTSFDTVGWIHWYLMVSIPHVYFAKNPGAIKTL